MLTLIHTPYKNLVDTSPTQEYSVDMRPISPKVKKQIEADPAYKVCMLRAFPTHVCGGRLTREHALIFGGRQVDTKFAIISCCAKGQEVDQFQDAHTMDKKLNVWVALNRATDDELSAISKVVDYRRMREQLNEVYGVYVEPRIPANEINYPVGIYL